MQYIIWLGIFQYYKYQLHNLSLNANPIIQNEILLIKSNFTEIQEIMVNLNFLNVFLYN